MTENKISRGTRQNKMCLFSIAFSNTLKQLQRIKEQMPISLQNKREDVRLPKSAVVMPGGLPLYTHLGGRGPRF